MSYTPRLNLYTNDVQLITYTPQDLWNRYSRDKRAVIVDFFHFQKIITKTTFPEVECALFLSVDRGIDFWEEFNDALKIWFPKLKTLLLDENYSSDAQKGFIDFFLDPWLEHIWIEDYQSGFTFIDKKLDLPKDKIRVFRQARGHDDDYINFIDEMEIDTDEEPPYIIIKRGTLQDDGDD